MKSKNKCHIASFSGGKFLKKVAAKAIQLCVGERITKENQNICQGIRRIGVGVHPLKIEIARFETI